jgi:hypothetical protein
MSPTDDPTRLGRSRIRAFRPLLGSDGHSVSAAQLNCVAVIAAVSWPSKLAVPLLHGYDSFGRLRSAWQSLLRPQARGATRPDAPAFDVYMHLITACSTASNASSIASQRQRVLARASIDSGAIAASHKSSGRVHDGKVFRGSTSAGQFVYPSQLTVSAIIFARGHGCRPVDGAGADELRDP